MTLDQTKYRELLNEYNDRKKKSEDQYKDFKEKINNAREAFNQKIPKDIAEAASSQYLISGNTDDDNCSKMLLPYYTAIAKKAIENLCALPPRYEWDSNDEKSIITSRALERELSKFYTKMNIGRHTKMIMHHFIVTGMFAQQTVYRKMAETVRMFKDGKLVTDPIYNGGAIDFIVYDPLTCYFDWDADITDMRRTSKFCIVTVSTSMSEAEVIRRYGVTFKGAGVSGSGMGSQTDVLKTNLQTSAGVVAPLNAYTVREYYTNDGRYYTIINDSYVAEELYASNGVADQIPINIGVAFIDPDNNCGTTLWEYVKWPVAAMSNAFNQVADNNAFNNNSPIFIADNADITPLIMDTADGRKLFSIRLSKGVSRMDDMLSQLKLPDITAGSDWMFNIAKESLFYVTGTNAMAFGIQDKQIRNQDVAQMVSDSLVRPDSDVAKNIEESFLNPITWDFLRIFYTRYDDFGFNKETVPRDFLKDYRSIRVVNGSYLTSDKLVRLAKVQQALEIAKIDPTRAKLEVLFYDLYDAAGIVAPYRYLKTEEEFIAEQYANAVNELLAMGAIDEAKAQTMLQAIDLINQNKDKFQEKK